MKDNLRFKRIIDAVFRTCGVIAEGFHSTCTSPPVGGLEVDIFLFNRSDINLTSTVPSAGVIPSITMKATKEGYKFVGLKTSNSSSINMNQGKYQNNFIHAISFIVFDNTGDTKKNVIQALADSNLVAVVRNKWKGTGSNMEFEVFGFDVGLEATLIEKKSDDADTQGAWKLTLSSPKDQFESNAGYILWTTSQAVTLSALLAITDTSS